MEQFIIAREILYLVNRLACMCSRTNLLDQLKQISNHYEKINWKKNIIIMTNDQLTYIIIKGHTSNYKEFDNHPPTPTQLLIERLSIEQPATNMSWD
jgi:hypothetical protein